MIRDGLLTVTFGDNPAALVMGGMLKVRLAPSGVASVRADALSRNRTRIRVTPAHGPVYELRTRCASEPFMALVEEAGFPLTA